jgi:putative endonuclease
MTVPCWWVYLLRCADDTFYVGVARDLAQRLREHNGELRGGARYTRGRRPVTVYAAHACADRRAATQLEWRTKRLPRARKEALPSAEGWLAGDAVRLLAVSNRQGPPVLPCERAAEPPAPDDS